MSAERIGEQVTVQVGGDVDLFTATELDTVLAQVQTWVVPGGGLRVDLAQVQFLSVAGMNALNTASGRCRAHEIAFSVIGASADINRHIALAGLRHCLT
ncbi:STAS domain-containing protein [Nocardia sp. NBC_01327]|uniref:STAS domain-containing protein n=1 Tax=Nocardia sp. NBC_01327 TaxID=2903593 RepID=UPI002E12C126|nr:STAS domain-containing protein [Nocardia sp. NBC_01327]